MTVASRELFKFLHARINKSLCASTLAVQGRHGFELCRAISHILDPVSSISDFTIKHDIRRIDKVGEKMAEEEVAFTIWSFMDQATKKTLLDTNGGDDDGDFCCASARDKSFSMSLDAKPPA